MIKNNDILCCIRSDLWLLFHQIKGKLIALLLKNKAKVDISYS